MSDLVARRVPGNTLGGRLTPFETVLVTDGRHTVHVSSSLFDRLGEEAVREALARWDRECAAGKCGVAH